MINSVCGDVMVAVLIVCTVIDLFFFFKQKTAYEMRISDWSSDVCSSDLPEFLRMLDVLRSGELDGVLVWKLDRLTRQQRDLVRVMEACEVHKADRKSVV